MTSGDWTDWDRAFGGLPPVGYILRAESATHQWLRLHSLPDAERYPSTPEETSEVLRRANAVASAAFGDGTSVTAWIAHDGAAAPRVDMARWRWAAPHPPWRCDEGEFEALEQARFLVCSMPWRAGALDNEFQLRALDELGSFTMFAPASRRAVCPYDGGIDLFLPSEEEIEAMRRRFRDWLPASPSGL